MPLDPSPPTNSSPPKGFDETSNQELKESLLKRLTTSPREFQLLDLSPDELSALNELSKEQPLIRLFIAQSLEGDGLPIVNKKRNKLRMPYYNKIYGEDFKRAIEFMMANGNVSIEYVVSKFKGISSETLRQKLFQGRQFLLDNLDPAGVFKAYCLKTDIKLLPTYKQPTSIAIVYIPDSFSPLEFSILKEQHTFEEILEMIKEFIIVAEDGSQMELPNKETKSFRLSDYEVKEIEKEISKTPFCRGIVSTEMIKIAKHSEWGESNK